MSKSVTRVEHALAAAGIETEVQEVAESTRTAAEAAEALGCSLDQIAKSVIFRGADSGAAVLFITAGGNRVDAELAAALASEALERADAAFVRASTGFAIGGVAPLGHLTPPKAFFDKRLLEFDTVWAAGGTPRHLFPASPSELLRAANATSADFTEDM